MQKYMQYVNIKFHETSTNNCLTSNSPTIVETAHFFLPTHEVINVYNFYSRQKYSLKLKQGPELQYKVVASTGETSACRHCLLNNKSTLASMTERGLITYMQYIVA